MENKLTTNNLIVLLIAVSVFLLFFAIVFNVNIHGDSKFHTQFAKESAETGFLVKSQPYRLYEFKGNERVYMPIAYPLTSESFFTVLYLFGGENLLKLYSPIFATLVFLAVYLLIRDIGTTKSLIISVVCVLAVGERLIMTPLIEPYLLLLLLGALYSLKKYILSSENKYLYLIGIFLGSSIAIKQQGLLDSIYLFMLVSFIFIFTALKNKDYSWGRFVPFIIFTVVFISIPSIAIKEQIDRTGTFAFSPGRTEISNKIPFSSFIQPLLTSKFETNPEAQDAINKTISYRNKHVTLVSKVKELLLSPFLFYRSESESFIDSSIIIFFKLLIFVLAFSFLILLVKKKQHNMFLLALYVAAFLEMIISFVLKTPISQYHSFGVVVVTILIFDSADAFGYRYKYLSIALTSLVLVIFAIGYVQYIYPLWFVSGRENNYQIESYKKIGEFVQKNTSADAIFLSGETSFRYYAKRDTVWLNDSIGNQVREIVTTSDDSVAITNLANLHVDYLVINKEQSNRIGVNDYMPLNGLLSIVNNSKYFTNIYDPNGDGNIVIYKVNYPAI